MNGIEYEVGLDPDSHPWLKNQSLLTVKQKFLKDFFLGHGFGQNSETILNLPEASKKTNAEGSLC